MHAHGQFSVVDQSRQHDKTISDHFGLAELTCGRRDIHLANSTPKLFP